MLWGLFKKCANYLSYISNILCVCVLLVGRNRCHCIVMGKINVCNLSSGFPRRSEVLLPWVSLSLCVLVWKWIQPLWPPLLGDRLGCLYSCLSASAELGRGRGEGRAGEVFVRALAQEPGWTAHRCHSEGTLIFRKMQHHAHNNLKCVALESFLFLNDKHIALYTA